jgi:hypothetical protein
MTPDRVQDALIAAVAQYHTGSHVVGPALPSPPLGPDLQPQRLASVPDHQQAGPPSDGVSAGHNPSTLAGSLKIRLDQLDERLAGLQELITGIGQQLVADRGHAARQVSDVYDNTLAKIEAQAGLLPSIHELLVAFMQAMTPVIELAGELTASGDDAIRAGIEGLGEQLGVYEDQPPAIVTLSDAQRASIEVAQRNGWLGDQPGQPAVRDPIRQRVEAGLTYSQAVSGLYGSHIEPEPDWAALHARGEVSDG